MPPGTNYPDAEVEPYVIADPSNPDNLLAGWQQDRWSNGGSRGLVAGVSKNGGKSWQETVPHGVTNCAGGPYNRASDPWVAYSASGIAYFMHLFIQVKKNGDEAPNGMSVTRSTDGGLTWQKPVTLIKDTQPARPGRQELDHRRPEQPEHRLRGLGPADRASWPRRSMGTAARPRRPSASMTA